MLNILTLTKTHLVKLILVALIGKSQTAWLNLNKRCKPQHDVCRIEI
jgi:hypothetical protein